jgi:hypothetical protein
MADGPSRQHGQSHDSGCPKAFSVMSSSNGIPNNHIRSSTSFQTCALARRACVTLREPRRSHYGVYTLRDQPTPAACPVQFLGSLDLINLCVVSSSSPEPTIPRCAAVSVRDIVYYPVVQRLAIWSRLKLNRSDAVKALKFDRIYRMNKMECRCGRNHQTVKPTF